MPGKLKLELPGHETKNLGVPVTIHEALMAAPSRGRYFLEHIKHRYPYDQA